MKKYIIDFMRLLGSRLVYLFIGLSFAAIVMAVNAAITPWTSVPTHTGGEKLISGDWNAIVGDLNAIKTTVDGMAPGFTTCVTKNSTTSNTNTAGDGYHYSNVDCDPGWTMTGGGCYVDHYCWTQVLRNSHPTANGWYCEQSVNACDWSHGGTAYARCCR